MATGESFQDGTSLRPSPGLLELLAPLNANKKYLVEKREQV